MMGDTIGKNIRKLRENMGVTQKAIARFLGVDQSFIVKVEKGERKISLDVLEKLSCLFGVAIDGIEDNSLKIPDYTFSVNANNFTPEELAAITTIHRIALNSE